MTRIVLISGSTRDDSLHTAALRTAAGLDVPGVAVTRYDGLRELPAFAPGGVAPEVVALHRRQVAAADALLFSTPEYAGGLPGSLKNLLDWLVDGGDLQGRPAAWLSLAAPGRDDGALAGLQAALEHGGARLLRAACVRLPLGWEAVGADGTVTDPRLHTALGDVLLALARSQPAQQPRSQPSWQANSSLFPVLSQHDASGPRRWSPAGVNRQAPTDPFAAGR